MMPGNIARRLRTIGYISSATIDRLIEGLPEFVHIERNEFVHRKHKKQKEEDIAICECKYDVDDPDSACVDGCLNVSTSTECTPGYCPCASYCRNQRFQKCENAKLKLFKTEGRGWGLLADETIKAGQFIIEYCGEVISCKEAKRRALVYESQGLLDAYIISLNGQESIDATKKGSLARFINHSCQPNCATRKWNVLGEIRVGIFAKHDIPVGTELAYDYNFEWYGGAKVRCLCGASCCSGFLGAKSRGFKADTYLWDDDDARYTVENIPTYDSEEDESASKFPMIVESSDVELTTIANHNTIERMDEDTESKQLLQSTDALESLNSAVPTVEVVKFEIMNNKEMILHQHDDDQAFGQKNVAVSPIRGNNANRNSYIQTKTLPKKKPPNFGVRSKNNTQKEVDVKRLGQLLTSKEAREEIYSYEEKKKQATSQLESVYDEIRPAIEEHERDSQDSVSTSIAEIWSEANCAKLKAEFDLSQSIIKLVACNTRKLSWETETAKGEQN